MIDKIYLELRKEITERVIPPGTKLSEAKLAKRWKVSRTPIREALRKLETEGLVNYFPYRGFIVNSISIEDVDQIYTIKISLEGLAGRLATPIISKDTKKLKILENLVKEMKNCSIKNDVEEYSEKNLKFHISIWNWCGNPWLVKILHNLSSQLNRFIINALNVPNRMKKSVKEHQKILDGFKMGNPKAVEKALGLHYKKAAEDLKNEIIKK